MHQIKCCEISNSIRGRCIPSKHRSPISHLVPQLIYLFFSKIPAVTAPEPLSSRPLRNKSHRWFSRSGPPAKIVFLSLLQKNTLLRYQWSF